MATEGERERQRESERERESKAGRRERRAAVRLERLSEPHVVREHAAGPGVALAERLQRAQNAFTDKAHTLRKRTGQDDWEEGTRAHLQRPEPAGGALGRPPVH